MSEPNRDQEKRHLTRLKTVRDGLSGLDWQIEADADGTYLLAVRADGEVTRIVTIHPDASPDEVDLFCRAGESLRFLLALVERAAMRIKAMQGNSGFDQAPGPRASTDRRKDNSAALSAKGLCDQVPFRRFLETKGPGGYLGDARAADTRLKFLLDIKSKAELNQPGRAREVFFSLRSEYQLWRRGDL